MNRPSRLRRAAVDAVVLSAWLAVTMPSIAHAYVDPGSGSVIVTAILGFFAAIGYTFRKYFYRLRASFSRKKADDDK